MKKLLEESGFEFSDSFLSIPENMKYLKIDVGLSENAPQSQEWIENDLETFVFGFEPILESRNSIKSGISRWPTKLDPKYIGARILIVPCALFSKHIIGGMEFNVTKDDPGCSSLLVPVNFEVAYTEHVEVWTIQEFMKFVNPARFPMVDHLKIDVQGSDFEVIKGIGESFSRFLAITVEIDTNGYRGTSNNYVEMYKYMHRRGFFRLRFPWLLIALMKFRGVTLEINLGDPTFVHYFRLFKLKNRKLYLYQRG